MKCWHSFNIPFSAEVCLHKRKATEKEGHYGLIQVTSYLACAAGRELPGLILIEEMKSNCRYVVFDLETTGISPLRGHRVIEIGAVAIEDRQRRRTRDDARMVADIWMAMEA